MKAVTWQGRRDVRVEDVPDPIIKEPNDAIIRVTSSGLCGSDLHLYETLKPVHGRGGRARARADGDRRGGRFGRRRPGGRRSRRRALPDLLRLLLDVHPGAAHAVRDHPGARAGDGRGPVRLQQALRRGPRRAGGVPPGARGPVHADQGARGPGRRALPVPLRRAPDRLAVRGVRRRARRRHAAGPRARPDRGDGGSDRDAPGLPGDRGRPGPRATGQSPQPGCRGHRPRPRSTTWPRRSAR